MNSNSRTHFQYWHLLADIVMGFIFFLLEAFNDYILFVKRYSNSAVDSLL